MKTIKFAGIKGKVIQSSPHGNYLVVQLSDRITITGTFSNQFNWEESPDSSSGFISFLTYIGLNPDEINAFKEWIFLNDGYFKSDEDEPRQAKRVAKFPLELKVRGLTVDAVVALVKFKITGVKA